MRRTVHYRPDDEAEHTTCQIRLSLFPKVAWSLDPRVVDCRRCLGIRRKGGTWNVRDDPRYVPQREAMVRSGIVVKVQSAVTTPVSPDTDVARPAADVASLQPYFAALQRSIDQLTAEVRELRSALQVGTNTAAAAPAAADQINGGRLMSIEECAAYLHRTPKAIRMLVYRGEIPIVKIGRRVQFLPEKIDRWMHRHADRGALCR
jgi:excisionase family DNA binding protein